MPPRKDEAGERYDEAVLMAALERLESQRQKLDQDIRNLRARVTAARRTAAGDKRKRVPLSPAHKASIAEAQRRRWAAIRAGRQTE